MNETAEQSAHPPISPHDILRLKRCPRCDYDLTGLPIDRDCPECGFMSDMLVGAIPVWRQEYKPNWWALGVFLILACIFGAMTLSLLRTTLQGGTPSLLHGIAPFVFLSSVFPILQWTRWWISWHRGVTSSTLLIAKRGYAIATGGKIGRWRRWNHLPFKFLERHSRDRWRLRLTKPFDLVALTTAIVYFDASDQEVREIQGIICRLRRREWALRMRRNSRRKRRKSK